MNIRLPTLTDRCPEVAEHFEHLQSAYPRLRSSAEAAVKADTAQLETMGTLSWITKDDLPLFLNVNLFGKARTFDPFTGPHAEAMARQDAIDNGSQHLTTIVLRSDGTWSEAHQL